MRMPTAGTPYKFSDVIAANLGFSKGKKSLSEFEEIIKNYLHVAHVQFVNSGTTACYILLQYLKSIRKDEQQTEIIITDYTAPSLLLPIQKAGLNCVVVDTSSNNFNMDIFQIANYISDKTLAIMPIHMFGIPTNVDKIISDKNIFIIEDAASSLGSKIAGQHTGTVADFGFYSLNRGKNISTLAGGIITWKNDKDSENIKNMVSKLPQLSKTTELKMLFKFMALTLAVRPFFYTILNAFISKFKYTTLHTDFDTFAYTPFQAGIGKNLWKREMQLTNSRVENGQKLANIFSPLKGIQVSTVDQKMQVAFNQFPILIENLDKLEQFEQELLEKGIETSRLYGQALHQIFPKEIKNASEKFSNAEYLAKHLLLIPPHAQIKQKHLDIIEKSAKKIFL